MSDLAPFVAATLRDKVVSDLQKENERLRDMMANAHKVEVTGPGGQPVYATGSFHEGQRSGGDRFWRVDLQTGTDGARLSLFREEIVIYLGGVEYVKLSDGTSYVYMGDREWDGADRKEIKVAFADETLKRCAVDVRITGWPTSNWDTVKTLYRSRADLDIIELIGDETSTLFPQASVSFLGMSFGTKGVKNVISNLDIPSLSDSEIEEDEKHMDRVHFIVSCLRESGNEEVGITFNNSIRDILYALYMLYNEDELTDEMREIIPTLVQMRSESSGPIPFLSLVKTRYDVPDQDWHREMFSKLEDVDTEQE